LDHYVLLTLAAVIFMVLWWSLLAASGLRSPAMQLSASCPVCPRREAHAPIPPSLSHKRKLPEGNGLRCRSEATMPERRRFN